MLAMLTIRLHLLGMHKSALQEFHMDYGCHHMSKIEIALVFKDLI